MYDVNQSASGNTVTTDYEALRDFADELACEKIREGW